MFSRLWRTECTPFLPGCSNVSMPWLLAGCELPMVLLPLSCLFSPRAQGEHISVPGFVCMPVPCVCVPSLVLTGFRFRSTSYLIVQLVLCVCSSA